MTPDPGLQQDDLGIKRSPEVCRGSQRRRYDGSCSRRAASGSEHPERRAVRTAPEAASRRSHGPGDDWKEKRRKPRAASLRVSAESISQRQATALGTAPLGAGEDSRRLTEQTPLLRYGGSAGINVRGNARADSPRTWGRYNETII